MINIFRLNINDIGDITIVSNDDVVQRYLGVMHVVNKCFPSRPKTFFLSSVGIGGKRTRNSRFDN